MLVTALVFFVILSILILIHEIGHFVAAKKLGIKVEEFGFGLPPRIFGVRRGETVYSVNWLPIGGFVKLFGEEGEEEIKDPSLAGRQEKSKIKNKTDIIEIKKRAFYTRPPLQRAVVIVAGVLMNFVLAVFIISFLFTQGVMVPTNRVHIEKIVAGSPAEAAGLKEKDIIKQLTINNNKQLTIKSGEQLINTTKEHLGEQIIMTIVRKEQEQEIAIVPRKDYPADQGPMGIAISNYEEKKYSFWQAPILGTKEALVLSWELTKGIGKTLWKVISLQPVMKDVAGPLGIAQMTGQAIKFGNLAVLELLGLLSLNLAIVNILPFPALDGSRLLFVIIEGLTGKRIKTHWERYVHQIGMVILLTLMFLVTLNDIVRIFSK